MYIDGKMQVNGKERVDHTNITSGDVPVLKHGKDVVVEGATDCIEYIDGTFGKTQIMKTSMHGDTHIVLMFLADHFTSHFKSMLLFQEKWQQEKIKEHFLTEITKVSDMVVGPYFVGEELTLADIVMAPWFERMAVLEHYRDFRVSEEIHGWVNWCE